MYVYGVNVYEFRCSFCDRERSEVRKSISGLPVFICDECVGMCKNIIDEEFGSEKKDREA